jgi:SH3 domain protein
MVVAENPVKTESAPAPVLGPAIPVEEPVAEAPVEEKVIAVVYVTDKLVLGMKDNPEGAGKNIKLLRSGMRLEVLKREGAFNKVRTEEGLVGWAKSNFMVTDKPAILVVADLKKENKALRKEIDAIKKDGVATKTETKTVVVEKIVSDDAVKQRVMDLEASLEEARNQLAEKEAQLEEAQPGLVSTEGTGISFIVVLIALLLGLGIGAVFMYVYFDKRISQRFAGLKV